MHASPTEYSPRALYAEADAFVRACYAELGRESEIEDRLDEIADEIERRGRYEHTSFELEHGAKMAWRNSNRCVGRLFWQQLNVADARDCGTARAVHEACCRHLERARNGGNIRPLITVFKPMIDGEHQVRLWNYELLRYAGYRTEDGIVGDPDEIELTEYCQSRGWEGEGTRFDILPHVIQVRDEQPELFEVPESVVGEVRLRHPEYEWFEDLGLKWYDVPVVTNMRLEIGGIHYTAAPFSGWYVSTEIGARNLADRDRYDMLPAVAERLGLDTRNDRTLWKDETLVELNRAVLHSFAEDGVQIVDHHTVTDQFERFEENEAAAGRAVTGDRSWLLPPMSPATTHVFENDYDNTVEKPNFFYQDPPAGLTERRESLGR
ncbi:nitric oxide synthase oxygenase [Halostagnicola sp. A56]|uniref:nitric oxide synthase oxygenase n=1 Tax=Halostagnicola sp. A56 TaxID=1495067 RepID=UPI0004A18CA7|nr:nitric oxide synthase oxygenase [Halostagnicola sp. A56]KDE60200.1 nitric oxide synthase oxygenase [Halostagnicola sp. A56]